MSDDVNPWQFLGIDTRINPYNDKTAPVIKQILQNLQRLLNARQIYQPLDESTPIESNLLTYGLTDLSQFNPESEKQRRQLCEALQTCISSNEPRLKQVQIELLNPAEEDFHFELHFRISGLLQMPKPPRFIQLESVLNLERLKFDICREAVEA